MQDSEVVSGPGSAEAGSPALGPVRTAIEISVSLLLVAALLVWCLRIIDPFVSLIVWGMVIAIALYPPFLALERRVGGSRKLAVALFVIIGLAVVLVPAFLFAGTMASDIGQLRSSLETGEFALPAPREGVREWPVIGQPIYDQWVAASENLREWLMEHRKQLRPILGTALSQVANIGLAVLQFVLATLVAAAMLANAGAAEGGIRALFARVTGPAQAASLMTLSVSTVRSVAVGVLGIAVIQAVAAGAGMIAVGVPAAGVLTLIILVLAIAQLPPWLILLPVIFYVFSIHDPIVAVPFAIWSLLVSFADMALKPLFLGRGVEAPMPVILIGAIGGMLMSGIIGLFVGAVVLALGYKLFQAWLVAGQPEASAPAGDSAP